MKRLSRYLILVISLISVFACSPKFDWRQFSNNDAPFTAIFPGKPASHSRDVDLDGVKFKMHMTAVDVNQISFAIAYAKIENKDKNQQVQDQQRALSAMQAGMLKNIQGKIVQVKPGDSPKNTLTAIGKNQSGKAIKMLARFTSHGSWIIQVVIIGDEKSFTPEVTEMFFESVKFN